MATATPAPNSIPYPIGTDRVMDGDNAMQAIAERVTTRLGAWQAYTPTFTNMGASGVNAAFTRTADQVFVTIRFTLVSIAAGHLISLPVLAHPDIGFAPMGRVSGLRQGARIFYGDAVAVSNNTTFAFVDPTSGNAWAPATPVAWVNGDLWFAQFNYRTGVAN